MRRLVVLLLAGAVVFGAAPALAQTTDPTAAETTHAPAPEMIPRPNEGSTPQDAGDPGGGGQLAVLGGIAVALGVVGWLAVRDVKKARSTR